MNTLNSINIIQLEERLETAGIENPSCIITQVTNYV